MHRFDNNQSPVIRNDFIKKPTNFLDSNFILRKYSLNIANSQFLYEDLKFGLSS